MCREFDPGFSVVAESWRKAHPQSDGVFFAKIDFAEGRAIFVRVPSSCLSTIYFSLEFNLRPMYGCILLLLVLDPNCLRTISPSYTTSPESMPQPDIG